MGRKGDYYRQNEKYQHIESMSTSQGERRKKAG
jgi:hypothetical protein